MSVVKEKVIGMQPMFPAFVVFAFTAFISSGGTFALVLPRLQGYEIRRVRWLAAAVFALAQTASMIFISCVTVILGFTVLFVTGGSDRNGFQAWSAIVFCVGLFLVFIATMGILGASRALGVMKFDHKYSSLPGALIVSATQITLAVAAALSVSLAIQRNNMADLERPSGYIDKTGRFVLKPKYRYATPFRRGIARVHVVTDPHEKFVCIDRRGNVLPGPVSVDTAYTAEVREINGTVDDDPEDYESERSDGIVGSTAIETKGLVMFPFSEGLALARKKSTPYTWGFVDKSYKFVIPDGRFDDGRHFSEGLAPVAVTVDREGNPHRAVGVKKWGYVDRKGKWIVSPQFKSASCFHEGLALVSKEDPYDPGKQLYGFVDGTGKFAVEPKFRDASSFSEGLAVAVP